MGKTVIMSLVLVFSIAAGLAFSADQQPSEMQSINTALSNNASSDDDLSGDIILAEMKKPPVKLTPHGGSSGGDCMSGYRDYYNELSGGSSGSDMPNVPIPGTLCSNCLINQADFDRPWSNAAFHCRSACCP